MKNANKLLFILISDYRKSTIAFFYLFDLFNSPYIISLICNNFQYGSDISLTSTNLIINLVSMEIAVIHYYPLDRTIKFVKILCFKFFKIDLDVYLEIEVFIVYNFI